MSSNMPSGLKRESWRPQAQPTSSWTPSRNETFRPDQEGYRPSPTSASTSQYSSQATPGSSSLRPNEASGSQRPVERERITFETQAFKASKDRQNDRDDGRGRNWRQRDDDDSFRPNRNFRDDRFSNQNQSQNHPQGNNGWRRNDDRARTGNGNGNGYANGKGRDDERSWSAWKEKVQSVDRDDNRRRDDDRGIPPARQRDSNAFRPGQPASPPRTRNRSPPPFEDRVRRPSIDSASARARARRASPDYGVGADRVRRERSSSRESSYSPIIRAHSPSPSRRSLSPIDRKRGAASPGGPDAKRPREISPARSSASSRRKRSISRSLSPPRQRYRRSPSPVRNGRPSPDRSLGQSRNWGRRSPEPPRREPSPSQRGYRSRDRSPSPSPRAVKPRERSLSSHRGNHSRGRSPSPSPRGYQQRGRSPSPQRGSFQQRNRSPSPPRGGFQQRKRSPSPPRGGGLQRRNRSPSPRRDGYQQRDRSPPRRAGFQQRGRSPSPQRHPQSYQGRRDQNDSYRQTPIRQDRPFSPLRGNRPRLSDQSEVFRTAGQDQRPEPPELESRWSRGRGVPEPRPGVRDLAVDPHAYNLPYDDAPPPGPSAPPVPLAQTIPQNHYQAPLEPLVPSGPVKISFNGHAADTHPAPRNIRNLFDTSPNSTPGPSQATSPSRRAPLAPEDIDRPPLQQPDVYLNLIAANERSYVDHLSTIAPYIQAAFDQWFRQDCSPDLFDFLVHYFGRRPTENEVLQVERLLGKKTQLTRDQAELKVLHQQALELRDSRRMSNGHAPHGNGRRPSAGHWSPPRDFRDSRNSRSPVKQSTNDIPIPDAARRFAPIQQPITEQNALPPILAHTIDPPEVQLVQAPDPVTVVSKRLPPGELYERLACVGEGTYGKVYKARNVETGAFVALKRIRMEGEKDGFPVTAMREIKLLQKLRNTNILRLIEMMVSKGSVYMVLEYMDHDLTGLLAQQNVTFTPANLKSLNYQMLAGLAYLHDQGILHRDMKGSNILLNASGELKLADFGLARVYSKRQRDDYTNRVITLWYRGPELLLGETVYGPEVDMWSAGCIMLELFTGKPVFQGNDEIHQLEVIYAIMGTPVEESWPGVTNLPWYELVKPKQALPSRFRSSFTKWLTPAALDLAEGLLDFDPKKRLSADAALKSDYFEREEPPMELPTHLANCGEHHEMSAKLERHRRRQEGKT